MSSFGHVNGTLIYHLFQTLTCFFKIRFKPLVSTGGMEHADDQDKGNSARGGYKCSKCGLPKKGHICAYQPRLKRRDEEESKEKADMSTQASKVPGHAGVAKMLFKFLWAYIWRWCFAGRARSRDDSAGARLAHPGHPGIVQTCRLLCRRCRRRCIGLRSGLVLVFVEANGGACPRRGFAVRGSSHQQRLTERKRP